MCLFSGILGSGEVLFFQIAAFLAVIAGTGAWVFLFLRGDLKERLKLFALPIIIWFVFGSLDILLTVRGTFASPAVEKNPLTRELLVWLGHWGSVAATILWITLWAGLVYAMNKLWPEWVARFVSLSVLWSLAFGHLLGFSSWFAPLCGFHAWAESGLLPPFVGDWRIIIVGTAIGAIHYALAAAVFRAQTGKKEKG